LYDNLNGLIDTFVEVFSGRYGVPVAKNDYKLTVVNYKDNGGCVEYIDKTIAYMTKDVPTMLNPAEDTDLLNIRDEMIAELNRAKYLLRLK
jgi:hypothetical protein